MSVRRVTVDSEPGRPGIRWTVEEASYATWRGSAGKLGEFEVIAKGREVTSDDAWREAMRQQCISDDLYERDTDPLECTYGDEPVRAHIHVYCDKSCVYFVQGVEGGPIKIGWASDLSKRIGALQVGSPVLLRILAIVETSDPTEERRLHRKFNSLRLHGEWFKDSAGLLNYIDAILAGATPKEAIEKAA